jgi:hypothetical protein
MYNCEILADSLSPTGDRITTMKITFPRIMLAEFNTHRMFSRNSASSRAIPFKKMVKMVEENPFIPIAWQKDHKGMQGTEYFTEKEDIDESIDNWLQARDRAVRQANELTDIGITKQLCNRLLEPFMWHTVIVTATEWENFFKLRCPQYWFSNFPNEYHRSKKDAKKKQPVVLDKYTDLMWLKANKSQADIHIQAIAELMWDAISESTPKELEEGEWHIPFGDNLEESRLYDIVSRQGSWSFMDVPIKEMEDLSVKIATARCARISYETLGDNPKIDYEADVKLHDRLLKEGHMSPFEHCARVMTEDEHFHYTQTRPTKGKEVEAGNEHSDFGWCRNFRGFIQYRHLVDT